MPDIVRLTNNGSCCQLPARSYLAMAGGSVVCCKKQDRYGLLIPCLKMKYVLANFKIKGLGWISILN